MCAIFVFYVHPERWIDWLNNSFCYIMVNPLTSFLLELQRDHSVPKISSLVKYQLHSYLINFVF